MIARRSSAEMERLREQLLAFMRRNPRPMRVVQLAWHFRENAKAFGNQLKVLVAAGQVAQRNGRYVIAEEGQPV